MGRWGEWALTLLVLAVSWPVIQWIVELICR